MKCQILFSGKNKKNISKCRLLKILPRVLSVNGTELMHSTNIAVKTTISSLRFLQHPPKKYRESENIDRPPKLPFFFFFLKKKKKSILHAITC